MRTQRMAYRLDKQGWIDEGMEKGRKEGREETVRKLVLKMLQEDAGKTFISKITGLSEDEIIKLKNIETREAKKQNCIAHPGGAGPEKANWYVYKFEY